LLDLFLEKIGCFKHSVHHNKSPGRRGFHEPKNASGRTWFRTGHSSIKKRRPTWDGPKGALAAFCYPLGTGSGRPSGCLVDGFCPVAADARVYRRLTMRAHGRAAWTPMLRIRIARSVAWPCNLSAPIPRPL
jgi:hypothetical protein